MWVSEDSAKNVYVFTHWLSMLVYSYSQKATTESPDTPRRCSSIDLLNLTLYCVDFLMMMTSSHQYRLSHEHDAWLVIDASSDSQSSLQIFLPLT